MLKLAFEYYEKSANNNFSHEQSKDLEKAFYLLLFSHTLMMIM